ncbi:MAG: hypothetical protein LC797_00870 [Chloroflexi bacterium]|nr:hypothetical protein [Chloroflexota bacterium]
MLAQAKATVAVIGEKDLRRQIDRAVSRAVVDRDYASLLLADPTVALEGYGCPPQQYLSLRSIDAIDVVDFAHQARELFWYAEPLAFPPRFALPQLNQAEHRSLAAMAAG